MGGLVLSDQFLQISTQLPSTSVFGFGENLHKTYKHDFNFKTWPMFARDQSPSHMVRVSVCFENLQRKKTRG